ncbi:MAG TPA: autotransporter domain-containing protein [Reyranella sp.]|nr:autotransporter domain-containing protein [Reyranella sp.]
MARHSRGQQCLRKASDIANRGYAHAGLKWQPLIAFSVSLVLAVATLSPAGAQSIWTGNTSSDWFIGGNWQSGTVPTPGSSAFIDTIAPNPTAVNGPGAQALDVVVGGSIAGKLTIGSNGTVTDTNGSVGDSSGSTGTVIVSGVGAGWINSGDLYIGRNGTGTLDVVTGGSVSNVIGHVGGCAGCSTGAVGTATVSGGGATWTNSSALIIGDSGTGLVMISGGGQLLTGSAGGFIGNWPASSGTMTVTDAGSAWNISGQLVVGGFLGPALGTLTVQNGGAVSNTDGSVGYATGSIGTASVSGAGATWTNSGDLYIGRNGTGSLGIGGGGTVSNVIGHVGGCAGCSAGAVGTVTVSGVGTTWTNSLALAIGDSGTGQVTISGGGQVLTGSAGGFIGNQPGSSGTMTVTDAGSAWNIGGQLVVGGYLGSALGTLTVQNGGTVTNTESNIGYAPGAAGTVTVNGAGTTWTNSGDLYVGRNGTGTLSIGGGGAVSNVVGRVGGCDACINGGIGTVTVSGVGSTWANSSALTIGDSGTGQVTISSGGQVLTGLAGGFLGNGAGSAGTMTVAGSGSAWTNIGNVDVGRAGSGTLTVGGGGAVNVAGGTGTIVVADQPGSIGAVNIGAAAGNTPTAPGALNAATVQFGAGTGALNFNHTASAYVFSPTITGAGAVNVLAGTTIFAGANSYTGATTISGGELVVNGSLASAVTVNGGTLSGIGTVGATTVNSGGTLGVGSTGMLTAASLVQNPGSTFQVKATPSAASLVTVTGTATLNGGTVSVLAQAGAWQRTTSYTILSAANRTGAFDGVVTNLAFLTPSLSYSSNAVTLTLLASADSFQNGAQTPNQRAVGAALDRANSAASGDFNTVLNALYGLNAAQGPGALDAIGGQIYSGFASLQVQSALLFMDSFRFRAGGGVGQSAAGLTGRGSYLALKADDCDNACDVEPLWGAWGGALGAFGTVAGDNNSHGLTYSLGGFIAGLDRRVAPDFRVGIAAGFNAASLYAQGMPGYGTSNTLQFALYGEYQEDAFYLDALAGYGHSDNRMTRPIVIPGLPFRSAQGYTVANTFFGQLEAGYKIAAAPSIGGFVMPFARLQASTSTQAGFTETGADSLDLAVAQQTTQSLRTVLGAQLGAAINAPWHESLNLAIRLGWSHEFADLSRPVTASFVGAPAIGFTTFGAAAPRDGVVLGVGANTTVAERTSVYFRYDGDLAGANSNHILSAGLRYVW